MRFRVNHSLLRIALCDDCIPDGMHKTGVPLGTKTRSADISLLGYPLVILQILGDRDLPRLRGANFIVDPLQEAPAIGQVAAVNAADVAHRIETQTIHTVFVQPKEGMVAKVLPRFRATVIRTGIAPGRVRAVVIIEINAPVVILIAPAVEAPKIEIAGAEVVVNHVHDHRDAQRMRRFYKPLKTLWPAERRFHREG